MRDKLFSLILAKIHQLSLAIKVKIPVPAWAYVPLAMFILVIKPSLGAWTTVSPKSTFALAKFALAVRTTAYSPLIGVPNVAINPCSLAWDAANWAFALCN